MDDKTRRVQLSLRLARLVRRHAIGALAYARPRYNPHIAHRLPHGRRIRSRIARSGDLQPRTIHGRGVRGASRRATLCDCDPCTWHTTHLRGSPLLGDASDVERVQDALKGINAASAGLVLTAAIRLFQSANTPPQHAILLLTFASLHLGWPATRLNVPAKYNPLVTLLVGLILGLVIGLPWLLTVVPSAPSSAAGSPPPPPFPFPPDPSPPPPPLPSPPEGERGGCACGTACFRHKNRSARPRLTRQHSLAPTWQQQRAQPRRIRLLELLARTLRARLHALRLRLR